MDLCLKGSRNLHTCSSQTDQTITQQCFLYYLLRLYQAFGVNLSYKQMWYGSGHALLLGLQFY